MYEIDPTSYDELPEGHEYDYVNIEFKMNILFDELEVKPSELLEKVREHIMKLSQYEEVDVYGYRALPLYKGWQITEVQYRPIERKEFNLEDFWGI